MSPVAISSLIVALALCAYASVSDIRTERVANRVLLGVFACGCVLDVLQYWLFTPELFPAFALNVAVTFALSLVLFFSHTWAGGDCKLACVLAVLYPAPAYYAIGEMILSLPLAIAIAFILGFIYVLVGFVVNLISKRPKLSARSIVAQFLTFAESYICALACVGALYLVNTWLIAPVVKLDPIAVAAVGFCCIWILSSLGLLKNRVLLVGVLAFDVIASVLLQVIPLGASPVRYLFVLAIVLLRIVMSQNNYQTIPTAEVKQGMILTTQTTVLFGSSRVKGLPGISTEDLRSRLTEDEASSVRRWGKSSRGCEEVQIVKKMPFAVFVSLGFIGYFLLWGVA